MAHGLTSFSLIWKRTRLLEILVTWIFDNSLQIKTIVPPKRECQILLGIRFSHYLSSRKYNSHLVSPQKITLWSTLLLLLLLGLHFILVPIIVTHHYRFKLVFLLVEKYLVLSLFTLCNYRLNHLTKMNWHK